MRKIILVTLLLTLVTFQLQAAIAVQITAIATVTTGQAMTVSVNVGSGTQRALVAVLFGQVVISSPSATYAGSAMTAALNHSQAPSKHLVNQDWQDP